MVNTLFNKVIGENEKDMYFIFTSKLNEHFGQPNTKEMGVGELNYVGQKVQNSSYKINKEEERWW